MASPNLFIKRAVDVLAYNVDFTPWLTALSDVSSAFFVYVPVGLTQPYAATLNNGVVTFWLSGGVDNTKYTVLITLSTTGGRIKEEKLFIKVQE